MDQHVTLPPCLYSDIFWFISSGSLCSWLATCSSSSFAAHSHPSWRHRSLCRFGGELAELKDHDWRQLYLRLSRTCHWMAALKHDEKSLEEPLKGIMTRRRFQVGHVANRNMELQWSLAVPTPELEAASLLFYDGVSCELCDMTSTTHTTRTLYKTSSKKVEPLRAVVGDAIFLLAKSDRVDIYDFNGSWTGELLAGSQIDLLKSTDMFLADGKLVVEQSLQLLVWDTGSSGQLGQLELIAPTPAMVHGQEEQLHPLQSRPSGASTVAIWAEEGGHSVQFWSIESRCRQVAQWVPSVPEPHLHTTLITFGVSVGEGLLVALDRCYDIHVAQLIHNAWQVIDIMVCPVLMDLPEELEPSILPCSVAVRCGMLCFVEAPSLESRERILHTWKLASEGEILPAPHRQAFHFSVQGQASVSVPKPIFGRFVILKNCSYLNYSTDYDYKANPRFAIMILDTKHNRLVCQISVSARDSTLFRRGHPLSDFLFGFLDEGYLSASTLGYPIRKLLLVNFALKSGEILDLG